MITGQLCGSDVRGTDGQRRRPHVGTICGYLEAEPRRERVVAAGGGSGLD